MRAYPSSPRTWAAPNKKAGHLPGCRLRFYQSPHWKKHPIYGAWGAGYWDKPAIEVCVVGCPHRLRRIGEAIAVAKAHNFWREE